MRRLCCVLALCFVATWLFAAESEHVILGKPVGGYSVNHLGYSCGYRAKLGCSAWVAYHLKSEYFEQDRVLKGGQQLYSDPAITASGLNAPGPDDLKESSLIPLFFLPHDSALGRGQACEKEVYSLANVAAARESETLFKVWRELDAAIRQWAQDYKEVWVIAGPIFAEDPERTASRKMAIPSEYYKIVVRKDGDTIKTVAFRIPQDASGNISQHLASIVDIEKQTDLEFFPDLPRDQRKAIKSVAQPMWELAATKGGAPVKNKGSAAMGGSGPAKGGAQGSDAGKSAAAAGGDGKVWVIGDKFYKAGSKEYGKGNGTTMDYEAATQLGFVPGN
ncbi:MAG: DNA/RNA non-specific endonuclease [bacterium]